jgi:hypothetical protein
MSVEVSAMPVYPFHVPRSRYRGNNPRLLRKAQRHNEIARACEDYLNRKVTGQRDDVQIYIYGFMARDLGLTTDEVRDVMSPVDCGHNGITIRKSANVEAFK